MFLELWSKGPGVLSRDFDYTAIIYFFPQVCLSLEPIGSVSQESKSSEGLGIRMDDTWLLRVGFWYGQWKYEAEVYQEKER